MIGLAIRNALAPVLFITGVVGVVAVAHMQCGCTPAADPSAQHRAVVLTLANGVSVADQACASVARAKADPRAGYELAKDCAFAYDAARLALIAADEKLGADHPEDVSCEVAQALDYARQMAGLIEKHGGKLPKPLVDAFTLAPMLAGGCAG